MAASPRKLREIVDREEKILDAACRMYRELGYLGLNISEIAERVGVSYGTVYGHFKNKEDILMEIAARGVDQRGEMFSKAAAFKGKSRERIAALGLAAELFVTLYPHYFSAEVILRTDTLREKTSPERQQKLRSCESRCMQVVTGVVRDAIAQGDLELPEGFNPEEISFGLWSLTYGAYNLLQTGTPLTELGVRNPLQTVRFHAHTLLDGLGWKPLHAEWDYDQSARRAGETLFAAELKALDAA